MNIFKKLKASAKKLSLHVSILYCAAHHPRTPWLAKLVIFGVVAYALSPIDLIPDIIPILGYLDDLLILPLGIALSHRLIPRDILNECTKQADQLQASNNKNWKAALVIIGIWLVTIIALGRWLWPMIRACT